MKTTTEFRKWLKEFDDKSILYIMHSPGANRWKIGITDKISERWYDIYSASPVKVTVYKVFICNSRDIAEKLEQDFIEQHQNRFVKGEWFECELANILQLEDTIQGYEYCHYMDRNLYDYARLARQKNNLEDEKRI